MEIEFNLISRNPIPLHPVAGTETVRFEYIITIHGNELHRNIATATINRHGVFLDIETINRQITDPNLRSQTILSARDYLNQLRG